MYPNRRLEHTSPDGEGQVSINRIKDMASKGVLRCGCCEPRVPKDRWCMPAPHNSRMQMRVICHCGLPGLPVRLRMMVDPALYLGSRQGDYWRPRVNCRPCLYVMIWGDTSAKSRLDEFGVELARPFLAAAPSPNACITAEGAQCDADYWKGLH